MPIPVITIYLNVTMHQPSNGGDGEAQLHGSKSVNCVRVWQLNCVSFSVIIPRYS